MCDTAIDAAPEASNCVVDEYWRLRKGTNNMITSSDAETFSA